MRIAYLWYMLKNFVVYEYKRENHYRLFFYVQSDIIETPGRCMFFPLMVSRHFSQKVNRQLFPVISLNREEYRVMTTNLFCVSASVTGNADISMNAEAINALKLMFWGV